MLIICEDCARRYNIDESRIKGNRARFTCKECGHIIVVDKADLTRHLISPSPSMIHGDVNGTIDLLKEMEVAAGQPELEDPSGENAAGQAAEVGKTQAQGLPFLFYLMPAFTVAFLCTSGVFGYLYFGYIAENMTQAGTRAEFLGLSLLLLGLSWLLSFAVLLVTVRFATGAIVRIKEDVLRILRGEKDPPVTSRGPREVRELADVLSKRIDSRH